MRLCLGKDCMIFNKDMKEKIISFCWQHLLLLVSLFIMTVGVAVCALHVGVKRDKCVALRI